MKFFETYCDFKNESEMKEIGIDGVILKIEKGTYKFPATLAAALKTTPNLVKSGYDTNYINRSGYQAFGMDMLFTEVGCVNFWESDYNKFVSMVVNQEPMDGNCIEIWEGIFWPSNDNRTHATLRDSVGIVFLMLTYVPEKDSFIFDLYTKDVHLQTTYWTQKCFTLGLLAFYECPEVLSYVQKYWWDDAEDIASGIKKLFADA